MTLRHLVTRDGELRRLAPRGTAVGDQLLAAFRDGRPFEELSAILCSAATDPPTDAALIRNCIATLLVMSGEDLGRVNAWLRP